MKTVLVAAIALSVSVVALAQDPLKIAPAHYKVLIDNAAVRVLKVDYPPGGKSAMHQHPDSIAVALKPSKVRFALEGGKSQDSDMAADSALYIPAGLHSPTNVGTGPVDVVLIEFKGAGGKAVLPAARPGLAAKTLAEGPRAVAQLITAEPTFAEPDGTKHDYDQVVVALSGGQMSLSLEGKPAKTTWTRGETVFIPRGTGHAAKNAGGKPEQFVIVSIR